MAQYQALYRRSIEEPEQFWAEQAKQFLDWSTVGCAERREAHRSSFLDRCASCLGTSYELYLQKNKLQIEQIYV